MRLLVGFIDCLILGYKDLRKGKSHRRTFQHRVGKVSQLLFDGGLLEALCHRDKEVQCLLCYLSLPRRRMAVEGAHVVKPVSELDELGLFVATGEKFTQLTFFRKFNLLCFMELFIL